MAQKLVVIIGFAGLLLAGAAYAAPASSYFPSKEVGRFLADKFDLASIRSSLAQRRTATKRTFSDLGLRPAKATDDVLVIDNPGDWRYELRIAGRGDVNGDGIEDLEVCFIDRAQNGGTYNNTQGLLLTRYSADAYAVALSFSPREDVCGDSR